MYDKPQPVFRPWLITAICSILFAAGIFSIIYTFTGAFAPYGVYYSALNAVIIVIMFAALSGIWVMEKWGVYLFVLLTLIKCGLDLYSGAFTYWELFLLIPVIVFLSRLNKMH